MTPEQQAREIMDHYFYPEVEGAETGLEAAIVSALAMRNQEIKRLTRIETRLQNRQWLIGVVRGALNSAIQEHGPINAANQISLEKRLVGFLTGQILRGDGPDHCPRCDALRAQRDALEGGLEKIADLAPGYGDVCELIVRIVRAALAAGKGEG